MDALDIQKWASSLCNELYTTIDNAAKNGNLNYVRILHNTKEDLCKVTTLEYSVCSGNLELVEWVYNHCPEDITTFIALGYAAGHGHLNVVKFLYSKNPKENTLLAIKLAAYHGKLDVLKWLVDSNELSINYDKLMKYAIRGEHPEVIKWIYEREYQDFTEKEYINCAKNGYTNIVKFFYKVFTDKNTHMSALYGAIESGNSPLAYWLNNKIEQDYNKTFMDYTKITIKSLISQQNN